MVLRPGVRPVILASTALMVTAVGGMMLYCLFHNNLHVHVATLAILTTSGPLLSRVFEGLVTRQQRLHGLDMNTLAADNEMLWARTVPLLMPIAGSGFAYWVMM